MSSREQQHQYLRAQLADLNNLLSMAPESAIIDRMSLEHRKSQVEQELAANPPPPRWPATVFLSFNGKPVVDRQGIYADFAGAAVDAFTKAVTSLAASQQAVLGGRGVIPNRDNYRLLVTGTSHGSFGFEIEEAADLLANLPPGESPVESALGQTKGILESLIGDEDDIAEAIADTDERALNDLRDFLKVMATNEAICSLSFKESVFRFRDVGQVQRGLGSLGQDNLHEGNQEMLGHFQGFLPQSRRAEFVDATTDTILSCLVDRSMDKAEAINEVLHEEVRVQLHFRQVGNSRPRYTITGYSIGGEEENHDV